MSGPIVRILSITFIWASCTSVIYEIISICSKKPTFSIRAIIFPTFDEHIWWWKVAHHASFLFINYDLCVYMNCKSANMWYLHYGICNKHCTMLAFIIGLEISAIIAQMESCVLRIFVRKSEGVGMPWLGGRLSTRWPTEWSNKWWYSQNTSDDHIPIPYVPVKNGCSGAVKQDKLGLSFKATKCSDAATGDLVLPTHETSLRQEVKVRIKPVWLDVIWRWLSGCAVYMAS